MNRLHGFGLLLAAILHANAIVDAQQPNRRVKHVVACGTCKIEFTRVATIGSETDPALLSARSAIDRDSKGRYFAFSDYSEVIVFDSAGKFLRTVGRAGNGPGEFGVSFAAPGSRPRPSISNVIVGPGDTVFVFHDYNISVLSPQLTFVRTLRITPRPRSLGNIRSLPDGTWLIAARFQTPELIGRSVHTVGRDGAVMRSLGVDQAVLAGTATEMVTPQMFPAVDEKSVWVADQYSFEQWRVSGNALLASLELYDVPWMAERREVTVQGRSGPTRIPAGGTAVNFLGVDAQGRLWITADVSKSSATNPEKPYILEVVDPVTATVRVSQRLSEPMILIANGTLSASASTHADGVITVTVWQFRVVDE